MSGPKAVHNLIRSILSGINYNDSKVDIKLVNTGGANYTSQLFEVTVTQEHKDTLHLFAKVATINDNMRKTLHQIYAVEDNVYRKVAVAYDEIQDKHRIPKDERFIFPKFYGSSLEGGNETFVFENLNLKGYQICDRLKPLDYQCLFETVTSLAKFHALGVGLQREHPELYKPFVSEIECVNMNYFVEAAHDQVQSHISALDEQYRERIQNFINNRGYENFKKFFHRKGNFLLHGDFRASNVMFKREGGKMIVIPVDYQCLRIGCPITDLLYFITMATDESFRLNHFEELIEHYHKQLSLHLSKLGVDVNEVYPKKVFQEEMKEMLPSTLLLALTILPLIMVDAAEAPATSDDKVGWSSLLVELNAKSKERVTGYLRDCVRWGII